MVRLVIRYMLLAVAVVILNFLVPRLLPGDPLDADRSDGLSGAPLSAEARAQLRAYYHLDQPLSGQFAISVRDLAHGDLGWSISKAAPVGQLVGERVPWTLGLVLSATVIAGVTGTLLGLWAAWQGGTSDRLIVAVSTSLAAIPEFLVAMGFLLVFAIGAGWFPLQGGRTAFSPETHGFEALVGAIADIAWHLALPGLTLVAVTSAAFVLLARGAIRGELREPYLVAARARGLSERRLALRHALPNALPPLLTLFGLRVGQVLGGVIVVERLFSVPGLGLLTFQAIQARDYPVLQAVFLLSGLSVLVVNFATEMAYLWLDPRRGT